MAKRGGNPAERGRAKRAKPGDATPAGDAIGEVAKEADTKRRTRAESGVASRVSEDIEADNKPVKNPPNTSSAKPEAKLDDEARRYIVTCNACFDTPKIVRQAIKELTGIDVTPQAIEAYDPTKVAGSGLRKDLKALFWETRKAFLAESAETALEERSIALTHRNVRQRMRTRMAQAAEARGNVMLAKELINDAAREEGEQFTNARVLKGAGKDGGHLIEGLAALFGAVDGRTRTLTGGGNGGGS
jgi:hypothetical protein